MSFKRQVLVLAVTFLSQNIFASDIVRMFGAISGGGGKGVVCLPGSAGSLGPSATVELLDIWEAKTFNGSFPQPSNESLAVQVDAALVRLKDAYPFQGEGYIDKDRYQDQDYVLALLRLEADRFLKTGFDILYLSGVTLTLTEDSYELAKPVNCNIEQIVNYQPTGRVLVNKDLFDLLNVTNQAALIAHEAFYRLLRRMADESNSIRTRRAIGHVFTGGTFHVSYPNLPSSHTVCTGSGSGSLDQRSQIVFYAGSKPKSYVVSPIKLLGTELIGVSNQRIELTSSFVPVILYGKCGGQNIDATSSHLMDGPVEFDRQFALRWRCMNGQFSMTLENWRPGFTETAVETLTCKRYP